MHSEIDTNDPFLALLTDALRAGPGSPEWHQAVAQLKLAGENTDEYKLLIEAREALESGRDYRSVRAGPGFTRKLLTELDQQKPPVARNRFHLATVIAILAGIVIVAVAGVVVYEIYPRGPVDSAKAANELASTYFSNEISATSFENGIPATWRTIGSLPLDTTSGLKAASAAAPPPGDYAGGGIVLSDPIPADKPIAFQVSLRVNQPSAEVIPQVFVANDPEFSKDRATSSHELVWQLLRGTQKVVVNGTMVREGKANTKTEHVIRVLLKGDLAVVEVDGRRWSGRSDLGDKPRYLGVRFIRTGAHPADITFTNVRVLGVNP